MLWLWHWPSSYEWNEWTPFKSLSTNARQASRAFSDVVNPTKNPNPRIQPTWLRSCLYRLVEPLIIKPIKMTQLSVILNNAFLCLLKFLTCSFPNYPAPDFSQWYKLCLCLVCACSLCFLFQCLTMFHREHHQAKGGYVKKDDGRTAHLWGIWLLSGIIS